MTGSLLTSTETFRQETADVLTRLRASLSKALSLYSSDGTLKSRDLQKRLGVDTRLSWQVARIINADDPLDLTTHIPSPALLQKLLTAARAKGASEQSLANVVDAYGAFEQLIQHYAGDRTSFDAIMARIVGGDVDAQLELAHRRSIFEGHKYVWGIALETFAAARILHPSKDKPGIFDCAHVRYKQNLQRLNTNVPIIVDIKKYIFPAAPPPQMAPIDPEAAAKYGMAIIPAFCSRPDLQLKHRELATGGVLVEWDSDTLGKPSAITLAFGDIDQSDLFEREGNRKGFSGMVATGTPTELSVQDILVPRKLVTGVTCEIQRLGHVGYPLLEMRPGDDKLPLPELPCRERMAFLGAGEAAAHLPEAPRYSDLLQHVCKVAGWDMKDFDVYRVRMEYPLLDTILGVHYTFLGSEKWDK